MTPIVHSASVLSLLLYLSLPSKAFVLINKSRQSFKRQTSSPSALPATENVEPILTTDSSSAQHDDESSQLRLLKDEILEIAKRTNRGFTASIHDQNRARELIFALAKYNPTTEPARSYCRIDKPTQNVGGSTLDGKWTSVYTDAPDITNLELSPPQQMQVLSIPAAAKLGRIGQECVPPLIQNVIEWRRPEWTNNLPFVSSGSTRVLQKVITEGLASAAKPKLVQLRLVGFELLWLNDEDMDNDAREGEPLRDLFGILKKPFQTRFPVPLPFGEFEILFLDDEWRAVRTGQNFLAVNIREHEWF